MNFLHTPGPWKFVTKWCDQVISEDGCICIPTEYNAKGINRTKLETRANARLIAAAPDLLDALVEIVDDYADRFDLDSPSTNPGIKFTIKQARAAIAAAEGKA